MPQKALNCGVDGFIQGIRGKLCFSLAFSFKFKKFYKSFIKVFKFWKVKKIYKSFIKVFKFLKKVYKNFHCIFWCWTLMLLAAKVIYCGIHGFIWSIHGQVVLYFICWMLDFNVTCRKKHLIVASVVLFEAFAASCILLYLLYVGL